MNNLRSLPSVDELLKTPRAEEIVAAYGRQLTLKAFRSVLDDYREGMLRGSSDRFPDVESFYQQAQQTLESWVAPSLRPVINATGVILHTNLGRAPVSAESVQAMTAVAQGYSTLEYDLPAGKRGSRSVHAEQSLRLLTGAEAALVVNNNAAALLLCLSALARRKRVLIARSQLVEIGGGFRVPDVMNQSGARLVEVGTTNRVHIEDFERELVEPVGLVMRAHHSNFKILGYTTEPDIREIVQAAHAHGVPVLDDLGSGALLDTAAYGLAHEPTVQESLAAGADLVCFSGDKLLGGPQAGIVLGKAALVDRIRKHALARAVRADKTCLAGISMTLMHYLKGEAASKIPVWQMIAMPASECEARAYQWRERLGAGDVIAGQSTVGGGSLPEELLPTCLLGLQIKNPNQFLSNLRRGDMPIVARIVDDRVVFDPRTVLPEQEEPFLRGVKAAFDRESSIQKRGVQ